MQHRLTFTVAELRGGQVRVPVRESNSRVFPGEFRHVDLGTARGRLGAPEIRAQAAMRAGIRNVTVSSRYQPGDTVVVRVTGAALPRRLVHLRIIEVHGRRVRDVVAGRDDFHPNAWAERHGAAVFARNPWCWCLTVKPEVGQ